MEEIELRGSIFITTKDIAILNGCSIHHAQREYQTLKDILQLKGKKVTVKAYCDYYEIDYKMVIKHINPFR